MRFVLIIPTKISRIYAVLKTELCGSLLSVKMTLHNLHKLKTKVLFPSQRRLVTDIRINYKQEGKGQGKKGIDPKNLFICLSHASLAIAEIEFRFIKALNDHFALIMLIYTM